MRTVSVIAVVTVVLAALAAGLATAAALPVGPSLRPAQATATPTPPPGLCTVDARKVVSPTVVGPGATVDITLTTRASCAEPPLHLVMVLDEGADLGQQQARRMRDAAADFITALDLPAHPHHQVAVVGFADRAHIQCALTHDAGRARACVNNVPSGATGDKDVADGIQVGLRAILDGRSGAAGVSSLREVMLLFSNGRNTAGCEPVLRAAGQAKSQGLLLASVCVGNNCDEACMRQAASSARYFYDLETFQSLLGVLNQISWPRRLTVTDRLAPGLAYVADSALPKSSSGDPGSGATWLFNVVPLAPGAVTITFKARAPADPGDYPTNSEATGELVDAAGRRLPFSFPVPLLRVQAVATETPLPPTDTPAPPSDTPTATPLPPTPTAEPPTATPTPERDPRALYLPAAWRP